MKKAVNRLDLYLLYLLVYLKHNENVLPKNYTLGSLSGFVTELPFKACS